MANNDGELYYAYLLYRFDIGPEDYATLNVTVGAIQLASNFLLVAVLAKCLGWHESSMLAAAGIASASAMVGVAFSTVLVPTFIAFASMANGFRQLVSPVGMSLMAKVKDANWVLDFFINDL